MEKSPEAFRTISEVADWLDTPAHVLRFWESRFTQIKPVKRAGGRRYYRPSDMALLAGLKQLLHVDGMTIKGAQKVLAERGTAHVAGLSPLTLPEGGTPPVRDRAARRARRARAAEDRPDAVDQGPAQDKAAMPSSETETREQHQLPVPEVMPASPQPPPARADDLAPPEATPAPAAEHAAAPARAATPPDMDEQPATSEGGAQVPAFLRRVRPSRRVLATLNAVERSRVAALYTRLENLRDRMRAGADERPD